MCFICQIILPIDMYQIKHCNKLGMEESRVFHIREYLEGLHMLMCRIKSNQN